MYYDGAINLEGPVWLPPSNMRTHIKPCKVQSKGTADDAIAISSREDTSKVVKPAKMSKSKLATLKVTSLKKGKSKYIPIDDLSDDEAGPAMADAPPPMNTDAAVIPHYQ